MAHLHWLQYVEFSWHAVVLWHKMFWLVNDLLTCLCWPINGDRERGGEKEGGRKEGRGQEEREREKGG